MRRIYNLGIDENSISIEIIVGTAGIAYTSVNQHRSGGQMKKLTESSQTTNGIIRTTLLGTALTLKNSTLIIRTIITFKSLDPILWEQLANDVVISYHLSGGFSGDQYFNYDNDDIISTPDFEIIEISKPLKLI